MEINIEGFYRNGRIELTDQPTDIDEGTRAVVTFVNSNAIHLISQQIDTVNSETLRASLATFVNDWDSPEMSIYDNYDAAKSRC